MISTTVQFYKLSSTAKMPVYSSAEAAGADLHSDIFTTVLPGKSRLIETNIAVEIPRGLEGQVRSRSGLALKKGIFVLNSPGTIDSDYRGPIGVILFNTSEEPFTVKQGDRIAQLVICPIIRATFAEVNAVSGTARGAGGFGSTGIASGLKPARDSSYRGPI